ncbi:P-loop containing nucleoside triphosphate hydrolase protein [Hypoxylon fragiforme]|uniref:P-loop containing nucleoside triphosphate hydrolase protein n=1 Tax=Hypoxylon fragiforme TaxID=63214 RepID=UPI0020C70B36|nr:P-loop containing nucleoside triphosphate hydrolase protein [Hypoxylon fragiforme]KAI2608745.1 P-loop containing nucleoside triphosphate hydrolase protein [Hypoxylon fragiforme]
MANHHSFLREPKSAAANANMAAEHSQQFRVPFAKNFSFTIPDKWIPNNPSVVRWINNLPGSVEREQPLEPARYSTPKHSLDVIFGDEESEKDEHRAKRARRSSVLSIQPSIQKIRQHTANNGLVRRVSNVCRRVVSRNKNRDTSTGFTISDTPSPSTPISLNRPRMRFVFVGESGCGKSSMLLRYYQDFFSLAYVKTQYKLFSKTTTVDEQDVDLEIWDTSGDLSLHQLQNLSYLVWDAVFLCFSVDSPTRWEQVQEMWVDEIHKFCRGAPVILLGLKKDTRRGIGMTRPLSLHLQSRLCTSENSNNSTVSRGMQYIECSAKTGENVDLAFEEAVRMVLAERAEEEQLARIRELSLSDHSSSSFNYRCDNSYSPPDSSDDDYDEEEEERELNRRASSLFCFK